MESGDLAAFVVRWSLDDRAHALLLSLPPEVLERVIAHFAPTDVSRGASVALTGFVKGMMRSGGFEAAEGVGVNAGAAPFQQFVLDWGLDQKAETLFYNLDAATQARVVREFAPSDTSKGASAAFQGFVNSVLKHIGTAASVYEAVDIETAFVQKWSLDDLAVSALHRLDPATKHRVMAEFAPNDVSRGASIAFMGFAKSVAATPSPGPMIEALGNGAGAISKTPQRGNPRIAAFVARWGLDDRAQDLLCSLDHGTQLRVMTEFDPRDTSKGASVAFMGFVKSVAAAAAASQPANGIAAFVAHWGLDERAQDLLCSLDHGTQLRVMAEFDPRDTSKGASVAFMGFVKSVAAAAIAPQPAGGMGRAAGDSGINAFVARWALDQKAQEALWSLAPDVRQRVMSDFWPKDTTRGSSVAFMGFLRSVVQHSAAGSDDAVTDSAVALFISEWGLDSVAQEALLRLDPETRQRAMCDFAPRDVSRGASAAFMGFVKSVAAGASYATVPVAKAVLGHPGGRSVATWSDAAALGVEAFAAKWELDMKAQEVLYRLEPSIQQRVMREFSPRDVSRGASIAFVYFAKSVASQTAPPPVVLAQPPQWRPRAPSGVVGGATVSFVDVDAFIATWALDGRAVDALRNLDPGTQQHVMSSFSPRDVSRGASVAFMGFLRSSCGAGQKGTVARFAPY